MSNINNANTARISLSSINRVLASVGIDPFPGPDFDALPDVTAPTEDEISTALAGIKGDPGKSSAVQALATRAWLAGTSTAQALEHGAWVTAWDTARAAVPPLLEDIRDRYAEHAEKLSHAAQGDFKGTRDLDTLDLSTLDTRRAMKAGEVIQDYRAAKALHAAWRTIWATLQGGSATHWSEMARPSNHDYRAARDATPQTFPTPDPWSVARLGWTGVLPESLKAARQIRAEYQADANEADEHAARTARRSSLRGGGIIL